MPKPFLDNFSKDVLLTTHRNADPDGLACLVAIREHFGGGKILLESISKPGKEFMRKLGVDYEVGEKIPDASGTIVVDCLSLSQTGLDVKSLRKPIGMIDHHFSTERGADHVIVEERPSCAEIVAEMVKLTPLSKKALLAGIVSDTGFFRFAVSETFSVAAKLSKDVPIDEASDLVFTSFGKDEKLAMLKSAKRLSIESEGPIIVTSEVGSYEAEAASSLVRLGADIAIVNSKRKDFCRVSIRSRDVGIHFGKLFEKFAKEHGGEGGGHDCAASMSTPEDCSKELLDAVKQLAK